MIAEDLRTYLLSLSAVTDLIDKRLYVQEAPQLENGQPQLPMVVYNEDDVNTPYFTTGEMGLHWRAFSFECWAPNYDQARNLSTVIRTELSSMHQQIGDSFVHAIFKTGGGSLNLPNRHGASSAVNGVELVVLVIFETYPGS